MNDCALYFILSISKNICVFLKKKEYTICNVRSFTIYKIKFILIVCFLLILYDEFRFIIFVLLMTYKIALIHGFADPFHKENFVQLLLDGTLTKIIFNIVQCSTWYPSSM